MIALAAKLAGRVAADGDIIKFYCPASVTLLEGGDPYEGSTLGDGYIYPPFFALAVFPLALLPRYLTASLWVILSLLSLAFLFLTALYLLERPRVRLRLWLRNKAALSTQGNIIWLVIPVAVLSARYCQDDLIHGQINIVLWAASLSALYFAETRRPLVAGALLGVAFATKFTTGALLLYFIMKKEYRVIFVTFATAIFFYVAPAAVLGWARNAALLGEWYEVVLRNAARIAFVYAGDWNMSLAAVIYRLGRDLGFSDIQLCYRGAGAVNCINWAAAAFLISPVAISFAADRRKGGGRALAGDRLRLSLIILVGVVAAPFSWVAHYVATFFPYAAAVYYLRRASRNVRIACIALLALSFAAHSLTTSDIWGFAFRDAIFYRYGCIVWSALFLYAALVVLLFHLRARSGTGRPRLSAPLHPGQAGE